MNTIEINSPDELYDFIASNSIETLLLGNGFGLSHPTLSEAFYFDFSSVIKDIIPHLGSEIIFTDDEKKCPEEFLDKLRSGTPKAKQENVRLEATQIIINSYIESFSNGNFENNRLWDLYKQVPYSCIVFLGRFKTIYTLNYDPLMYFEFLKLLDTDRLHHIDGFKIKKEGYIEQKSIVSNLKKSEYRFVYLHGSYFININKRDNKLNKLARCNITRNRLRERLFDRMADIRPFLILEGTWKSKKDLIDKYGYFRHCYESLQGSEENVLVYGMSFKNDDHILEALLNKPSGNIFITYCDDKDKKNIEKKISDDKQHKFHWIKLNISNCIWLHDEVDDAVNEGFEARSNFLSYNSDGNPSRWMADVEDAISNDLPELIDCIKEAQSIEDLNGCQNNKGLTPNI